MAAGTPRPSRTCLAHFQQLSQEELKEWYRYDPEEARALWAAAEFNVPIEALKVFQGPGPPLQYDITEFTAQSLNEALGIRTEFYQEQDCSPPGLIGVFGSAPYSCWASRRRDDSGDPKEWDLLSYGTGEAGGTTGIPNDSHLVHYDPRGYAGSAFNHSHLIDSPRPEIEVDARTLTGMLEAQEQEIDFDTRVHLLTDAQRWILDNAWCVLPLPVSTVQYYAFNSRLRDFAPDDWGNFYDLRRESMWLADA